VPPPLPHPAPTERLTFRRATLADAPFFVELMNSPGWLRNIGDRNVHNETDAVQYLTDRILPAYQIPGCGPMLCRLKTDGTIIGNTGVYERPGLDVPDFGFAFLPDYHGKGYAYEASVSHLAFAEAHGHTELLAITLPANGASLRLLRKLDFRDDGVITLPNDEVELLLLRWVVG